MKTACIYHSVDLDGWMSAAIVKHWFVNGNGNSITQGVGSTESIDFIGYNYGQQIPDLSEYDKVIMCDISFPKEEMVELKPKLIWIDHHISAINEHDGSHKGLRGVKFAACELTWKYFFPNEPMPEIVRLLGRYDCFGHKGTEEEQKVLEFQYGTRAEISNYEQAYDKLIYNLADDKEEIEGLDHTINRLLFKGKSIYQYLCTEAKQVYKNGFLIMFFEDSGGEKTIKEECKTFLCINRERFNPINFGIDYHKDGYDGIATFHYVGKEKLWKFSLYNDNGLVDCSLIAKQFGGGGHKGASGFVVKDLNQFLLRVM